MKRKGRLLKLSVREREFERLLRRASEITTAQRAPMKGPLPVRKLPSLLA